jgi:hypothetical protein
MFRVVAEAVFVHGGRERVEVRLSAFMSDALPIQAALGAIIDGEFLASAEWDDAAGVDCIRWYVYRADVAAPVAKGVYGFAEDVPVRDAVDALLRSCLDPIW